uniref:Uncharacterized protein n=1 Tax=Moniliophthora roreri TaxID=221103 RepID=A0A0W0GB69_MONRR
MINYFYVALTVTLPGAAATRPESDIDARPITLALLPPEYDHPWTIDMSL